MPQQSLSCFAVDITRGGAHLFIRVRVDIFHEEIEDAGFALQNAQYL